MIVEMHDMGGGIFGFSKWAVRKVGREIALMPLKLQESLAQVSEPGPRIALC